MDHHLQDKLQQFSATPPEGAWQKIADALDTEESFPQRLFQFEEKPPASAWQKIEKGLDETVPAKIVPLQSRFQKPLRYAAVAGLLAVAMVTITLLVKRTEAGALDPESNTTVQTDQPVILPPSADQNKPTPSPTTEAAASVKNDNATAAQLNKPAALTDEESNRTTASLKNNNENGARSADNTVSDYVFFRDGDGQRRKVSKKMADFVNCKEEDIQCKQRLKEVRQRMAASAMTTDFTGVLDLLRTLQ